MANRDEIFGVENPILMPNNIIYRHRIYVMNKRSRVDFVPRNAQITAIIAHNHVISGCLPLTGAVEPLIEISIKTECLAAYRSVKDEVLEAFLEGSEASKLRIPTTLQRWPSEHGGSHRRW